MSGRICLVTGATSGIGHAAARGLAGMGATVVLVARHRERGEAARDAIRQRTGNQHVDLLLADLSSQQAIRQLAADYRQRYSQLHVLINNAGGIYGRRATTADGLETTFAVNHLAYFLLTNLLLDLLTASAPARIINVTSEAEASGRIDFNDLQAEKGYSGPRAYSQSKLANVLFTYELARRLAGTGVTANCVHPGSVRTGFGRGGGAFRLLVWAYAPFSRSPEKGAETVIYLASSPDVASVTGKYFVDKRETSSSAASRDEAVAKRLWQVSAELTHLA